MARRPRSFYAGLSFRPPAPVAAAARRALERLAQQPPSRHGMSQVGLARVRQLLHRQELSPQTIDRMVSYFARHQFDKRAPAGALTARAVRPGPSPGCRLDERPSAGGMAATLGARGSVLPGVTKPVNQADLFSSSDWVGSRPRALPHAGGRSPLAG
jgi:hypothetical protein